ncbi:MAG: hypothetical protein LLG02_03405, partial [Pelosinus sp.]|nr:hypothetical protein [Pelosinus sp.]
EKVTIDGPLIQYEETDWQFIIRLASLQEDVIVPNVILNEKIFSFGYPPGEAKTLPDTISYTSGKDIAAFRTDVESEYKPNLLCSEYAYYEVESYDELTIGDPVTFQGFEMYVGAVDIELKDGILVYQAKLIRKMMLRQNPILNEKFQGVSLEGKVLAVQNQEIKLHLDIDEEQDEATAYWYPFEPPTTDMLYLMPQIGTNASLYMPGIKEQKAIITGCVRTNGGSCEKTGDPSTRYLGTEYGQEMRLAPGGIYFTAGRNDLVLTFDDNEGVKISSHKEMVLAAEEEIVIDSKTKVVMNSPNLIRMVTPTGGVSIENEVHFADMKTIIECTDETEFPLAEQKLDFKVSWQPGNEGINWGGLVKSALGAIGLDSTADREGQLVRQNLILGIAAPVLAVGALFVSAPVALGLGVLGGGMALKALLNNEELRQSTHGEVDVMYCINQGLAIGGIICPLASVAVRSFVKFGSLAIETAETVDGVGALFGLSTRVPSIALPAIDQYNYNNKENKD